MKLLSTLLATLCLAITAQGQTIKTLGYNTNGQVVANTGTNVLTFTNANGAFFNYLETEHDITVGGDLIVFNSIGFSNAAAAATRTNLGLGATSEPDFQGVTLTEGTNSFQLSAFAGVNRTNLGLGATDSVMFADVFGSGFETIDGSVQLSGDGLAFSGTNAATIAATTRTNLGLGLPALTNTNNANFLAALGVTNSGGTVTSVDASGGSTGLIFSGGPITNSGTLTLGGTLDIVGGGTGATNTTNARSNLGLGTTNAVQFASVLVGDGSSTNTAIAIGAAGTGLRTFALSGRLALTHNNTDTVVIDSTAFVQFDRPLRYSTNVPTNAPANTTNVAAWTEIQIGTNSYRVPLYQ